MRGATAASAAIYYIRRYRLLQQQRAEHDQVYDCFADFRNRFAVVLSSKMATRRCKGRSLLIVDMSSVLVQVVVVVLLWSSYVAAVVPSPDE